MRRPRASGSCRTAARMNFRPRGSTSH